MTTALQSETCERTYSSSPVVADELGMAADACYRYTPHGHDCNTRLVELLAENPVDLTRVSDEIRTQPKLAAVVEKLAALLQLPLAGSISSVEEATIVLGTARLRVLLCAWPIFERVAQGKGRKTLLGKQAIAAKLSASGWAPESIYLANLERILGLGDRDRVGGQPEVMEMAEMLVREFLALIPAIDPKR